MMKISQVHGEPATFTVEASSGGLFYKVDLTHYRLNGECDCPHFRMRLEGKLKEQPRTEWSRGLWRCKHIDASREYALNITLREYMKERWKPGSPIWPDEDL